jgi:tetratricopeptide (TPR) repeat protein
MRSMRPHLAALLLVPIAVTSMAPAVRADDTREKKKRAVALLKEGSAKYELGKWDEAIALFEQSFEVWPFPEALFNLCQAHRQKQDYAKAVFQCRAYLRNAPNAPNREAVESRIAEMEQLQEQQASSAEKPPTGVQTPEQSSAPPEPAPAPEAPAPTAPREQPATTPADSSPKAAWYSDRWGWVVTGAGVVGLGVGTGYLLAANSRRDDLATATEFERMQIRSDADDLENVGVISLIAGGLVTAAGIAMLAYNPEPRAPRLQASLSARGAWLGFELSF